MALNLPQRRHRKMLRDGSSEVWPEDAERIFLDGLKLYWASPWANFSRGRSRWRNQFLVDHLNKHQIIRTKKQVASHIQVLRNMWKGHPGPSLLSHFPSLFSHSLTPARLTRIFTRCRPRRTKRRPGQSLAHQQVNSVDGHHHNKHLVLSQTPLLHLLHPILFPLSRRLRVILVLSHEVRVFSHIRAPK